MPHILASLGAYSEAARVKAAKVLATKIQFSRVGRFVIAELSVKLPRCQSDMEA
jgi:hypothetical protein